MNKPFASYVAETKSEYKYILKFAVDDLSDAMIDTLEECLKRYDIKSASAFKRTPIQENPLDFPNVKNMPVHSCELVLGYPGSLDFLRTYISNCTGISQQQIAVYSSNDPRQIETDLFLDRNSPEYKKNYKTRLGSDYEEVEGAEEEKYGEKYNVEFLKELEKVRKERELVTVENSLSRKETVDHSTLPNGYDSFNDDKNLPKDQIGLFGRIKKPNVLKVGTL